MRLTDGSERPVPNGAREPRVRHEALALLRCPCWRYWAPTLGVQRVREGLKAPLNGRAKHDPNWRVNDASPRGTDSDRTFS